MCYFKKYIYEPIPNIDPQKSKVLKIEYGLILNIQKFLPKGIVYSFKNPNESVPSTWASQQKYNWKQLRENTLEIEKYIIEHKELPDKWKK